MHHPSRVSAPHDLKGLVVVQVRHGPLWNFSYLAGVPESGEAIVVDPGADVTALLDTAESLGLRITAAVATHFHRDHTAGLDALQQHTAARIWVHEADAAGLRDHYTGPIEPVVDGVAVALGNHRLSFWHTPGHTRGSQWLVLDGAVFTGDSLMVGIAGRPGHEEHAAYLHWRTLAERLPRLPEHARIYPGHDYGRTPWSTVAAEREGNPSLTAATFEDFLASLGADR